ncbi:phosphoglycerate mutase-like protein [Fistulina hepatica ATCC 64428]|uniref:Phosphoglycerate mutase-like protein n=1 Tax=Fistulina hepatica ATCC 64428 TaxID=1128425 RepID=A0A0D6ZYJ2_9AGAR|nr:phosphoglycerate mutase-like protein [Fistulina hepatica ATCC 64428]
MSDAVCGGVSLYDKLGNLSPFHKAPMPSGVNETLPDDCTVDQLILMGRHGSRYPLSDEIVYITNLTAKLADAAEYIAMADLPDNMLFLKHGYKSDLGTNNLTAPGRQQLFNHGVNFRLRYPNLNATGVLAGGSDRVVESAQWFREGYFGRYADSISTFSIIAEDEETISWITPEETCPNWSYSYGSDVSDLDGIYLPPITERLNSLLPGVNLTDNNTHGALYACAYDYATWQVSPWCDVFMPTELANFDYELDLLMDGAYGYELPDNMGRVLGSLYVNKLIERFTNSTGNASTVYLEFGHDTTIDLALTALGLAKDTPPLSAYGPVNQSRAWSTSKQVPFGAKMAWERFSCTSSFDGPQVRLLLNDAPYPLDICATSIEDHTYASCSLDAFVTANNFSTSIQWGDSTWDEICGTTTL